MRDPSGRKAASAISTGGFRFAPVLAFSGHGACDTLNPAWSVVHQILSRHYSQFLAPKGWRVAAVADGEACLAQRPTLKPDVMCARGVRRGRGAAPPERGPAHPGGNGAVARH
jgi:hypothetical protein